MIIITYNLEQFTHKGELLCMCLYNLLLLVLLLYKHVTSMQPPLGRVGDSSRTHADAGKLAVMRARTMPLCHRLYRRWHVKYTSLMLCLHNDAELFVTLYTVTVWARSGHTTHMRAHTHPRTNIRTNTYATHTRTDITKYII